MPTTHVHMRGRRRREVRGVAAAVLAVLTLAPLALAPLAGAAPATVDPSPTPGEPARYEVEDHYRQPGPFRVGVTDVSDGIAGFRVFHPRSLGTGGARHPILTWGNGTNSTTAQYPGVLRHLASWGFVVIGSADGSQASGSSMLAAARHLVGADLTPGNRFFGALDSARVGAVGHSQGAGGVINAANRSGGLIDTVVPINLPDRRYVGAGGTFDVRKLTATALYLGGGADGVIASPAAQRSYFDRTPRAALAVLRNADHLTIQRSGGGYLGYLTAWLRWHLQDDRRAAAAFVGADPEAARNSRWQELRAKGLALN